MADFYYLNTEKETMGPVSFEKLQELESRGHLTDRTYVVRSGEKDWQRWDRVKESLRVQEPNISPLQSRSQPPSNPRSDDPNVSTRRLAIIMFTDVVGYSAMMGQDEKGTLELLAQHNRILDSEISKRSGHRIKTIGDSYLVDFKSAVEAVECAISIQENFARFNQRRQAESIDPVLLRIGIHVGDVVFQNEDVFGDGVNISQRLVSQAEPGGICISEDVYKLVGKKIGVHFQLIGEKRLKNIERPIRLYVAGSGRVGQQSDIRKFHGLQSRKRVLWVCTSVGLLLCVVILLFWLNQKRPGTLKPSKVVTPTTDRPSKAPTEPSTPTAGQNGGSTAAVPPTVQEVVPTPSPTGFADELAIEQFQVQDGALIVVVFNKGNRVLNGTIEINLFDKDDIQVGSQMVLISNLSAGKRFRSTDISIKDLRKSTRKARVVGCKLLNKEQNRYDSVSIENGPEAVLPETPAVSPHAPDGVSTPVEQPNVLANDLVVEQMKFQDRKLVIAVYNKGEQTLNGMVNIDLFDRDAKKVGSDSVLISRLLPGERVQAKKLTATAFYKAVRRVQVVEYKLWDAKGTIHESIPIENGPEAVIPETEMGVRQ